jgi:hypothetical protein
MLRFVYPAEVRTDVGVLCTPRVPGRHAFLEYRDVLVVRHESTSNSGAPNDSTVRGGAAQGQKGLPVSVAAAYLASHVAAYSPGRGAEAPEGLASLVFDIVKSA